MPRDEFLRVRVVGGHCHRLDGNLGEARPEEKRANLARIAEGKWLFQRWGARAFVDRPCQVSKERILVEAAPGGDDHFSPRRQHASHLVHRALPVGEELHPLLAEEEIEGRIREWQLLGAALHPLDRAPLGRAGPFGHGQHVRAEIEADDRARETWLLRNGAGHDAAATGDIEHTGTRGNRGVRHDALGKRGEDGRDEPGIVGRGGVGHGAPRRTANEANRSHCPLMVHAWMSQAKGGAALRGRVIVPTPVANLEIGPRSIAKLQAFSAWRPVLCAAGQDALAARVRRGAPMVGRHTAAGPKEEAEVERALMRPAPGRFSSQRGFHRMTPV